MKDSKGGSAKGPRKDGKPGRKPAGARVNGSKGSFGAKKARPGAKPFGARKSGDGPAKPAKRPYAPKREGDFAPQGEDHRPAAPRTAGPRPERPAMPRTAGPRPERPAMPRSAGPRPERPAMPRTAGPRPERPSMPRTAGPRPERPAAPRPFRPRTTPIAPAKPKGDPRAAAFRALQDLIRSGAFASQALSRQLDGGNLTPEDRRLAANIFYTAAENRLRIAYALSRFMETVADAVTEDILHIAAAQLLLMDRLPDHAVVDEAVKMARHEHREGLTGLVNGVLRSIIRARDEGDSLLPDPDGDHLEYLSVRYSVARHIAEKLIDAYGAEMAEEIMAYVPESRGRCVVRPNTLSVSPENFETWLSQRGFHYTKSDVKNAFVLEGAGNVAALDGYQKGFFSLQGESSMLAAYACLPRTGMQILDACAAPGGKSALLCEQLNGTGRVFAWDVYEHRVELIRAAGRRLQLDNLRPVVRDARQAYEPFEYLMDAVLVDAPCSGLGVAADKPDVKYRLTGENLAELPVLQAQILENCSSFVKPGGLLVYSTCTILPEENEHQVRAFLEKHPEFVPDGDVSWLPERLRDRCRDGMAQFISCRDGVEGFFIARMRRKGF